MFSLAMLFIVLPLLYVIYGLLGRKLTIGELDRKAVLITGCGNGFGRDLVKRCLQNGLTVFAGCRRAISVKELEESYSSISQGRLYAFQMDVTDDESVRKSREIVDTVLREKNLVFHALINNAGVGGNVFYDDFLTVDDYKDVWEVNMCGVIRVTQTFRDLIKKSRGRIVICSSACILFTSPSHGPYASSKFAVHAYTAVLRHELQPYGVDVIEIVPGSFDTGMSNLDNVQKMLDTVWYRASQKLRDEYGHNYKEKATKFIKELGPKVWAKDLTWVTNSYYEAIVARRPKLLYQIGWDVLLKFYPYSLFPLRLQLHIMKILMYLNRAPLPAITMKNAHPENQKVKNS
uniref:Oxidoreductase n=1 Tax=Wuchereria bancrofti TaxID=6293 RepID=A0AAF5Q6N2_WUCBA